MNMDKSTSSTNTKRSFYRKKHQQNIIEQPAPSRPTTLMPNYLTTESTRKITPIDSGNIQVEKETMIN